MFKTLPLHIRALAVASLAWILAVPAHAQSVWNTTTGSWNTSANWLPAGVPVSDSTTALTFGGGSTYTTTNNIGAFSLNQLTFSNTAGTVTLTGSPTTNALSFLNSSTGVSPGIALTGAGNATISSPVNWTANTSATNSGTGTLTFGGTQTFTNGTKETFTNSGTGTVTLADGITYAATGTGSSLVLNLVNNNPAAGSFNIGNIGNLASVTVNIGGTGTVRFNGSIGGDLFGASSVLNVLSGATFDFNGNGESMGAISGAGTIVSTVNVAPSMAGIFTFSGKFTGAGGSLTVAGASHTLDLAGSTSDYTGATTITAGHLVVSANAPNGSAGALGNAISEVLVGDTSGSASTSLMIDTAGVNIGRNIRIQTGSSGISSVGGTNTSGTVTYSGNLTLGTDTANARGVTLYAAPGGITEFTGGLLRATGAAGTTDTVTITGGGTVAMRGTNTYTGTTTVSNGLLLLDDATSNTTKLSSSAALVLNGGSVSLTGSSAGTTSEAANGLTLGSTLGGSGTITVTAGSGQGASLNLGNIQRNTGATVNFATISNGGAPSIAISSGTAGTMLGAYATYNLNDWATVDTNGNVTAFSGYSSTIASGNQTNLTASPATLASGGATTNSLRFANTATATIGFNATTPGTLTLGSGGILVTSGAGATNIGTTTTRGTLTSTTGEVIIQQQDTTNSLTINSVISGTNLTKSGDGTLVLTGTNTYTGTTYINGGTVSITSTNNLGSNTSAIDINGGTLAIAGTGTINVVSVTGHVITVGPAGATFNFSANPGIAFTGSGFTGSGPVTKTGTGSWNVGATASSFSGTINVAAGTLAMTSAQLQSAGTITVASGAAFNINDDGTGNWFSSNGTQFLLNGTGVGGTGAFHLTDQTTNTAVTADPTSTVLRDVVLQTSSLIQTDNGNAAGSLSTLIFSGIVSGPGALIKGGNGVLVVTNANNSWSGGTNVQGGILRLNLGNDRLPTSTTVTLGTGTTSGVLQINGFTQTIAGLATSGTGTANEVTNGSSTATGLLTVNVANGSQTYSGLIGGTGLDNTHANNNLGFIKDGAGSMQLSGANTYSGVTLVKTGTLMLGNTNALGNGGAGIVSGNGGTTVTAGATLDLNGQTNINEVITLNGTGVGGAGALVNNSATPATLGNGVSSLSTTGTATGWTGGATMTIGTPGSGTAATATALLGLTNASLSITSAGSGYGLTPVVTVSGGGGTGAVVAPQLGVTTASYTINAGNEVFSAAPTVTLSNGATATVNLSGGTSGTITGITVTNPGSGFSGTPGITFSGGTVTSGSTAPTGSGNNSNYILVGLTVTSAGSGFTSAPTVTITAGTGSTATIGVSNTAFGLLGLALTNNGSGYTSAPTVGVSGGTATATANLSAVVLGSNSSIGGSGSLTVQSPISGAFGITKVGTGTTTLSGTNTYTGTTTVSNGVLQIGAAGSGQTGTGAVTVQTGGQLSGTGTVQGSSFTLASGATLRPGDITSGTATGNGTLTFTPVSTGSYNLQSGSSVVLGITSPTVTDATFGGNAVGSAGYNAFVDSVSGPGAYNQLAFTGGAGSTLTFGSNLTVQDNGFTPAAGEIFSLLDWNAAMTTNFSGFNTGATYHTGADDNGTQLDLPDISSFGLAWDTSRLKISGNVAIVSFTPEPGRCALLFLGLLSLCLRRRR